MIDFNSALNEIILDKIYEELPGKKTRKHNGQINVRCWICGDSHKKMSKRRGWFYTNNNPVSYFCFNNPDCATSGINLLAALCRCSSKEASKMVFNKLRKYSEEDTTDADLEKVSTTLKPVHHIEEIIPEEELEIPNFWVDLNEDAKTILKNRKILEAPYAPTKWKLYYSTRHKRIAIPWVSQGKLNTYQYRAMYKGQDPKYIFKAGSTKSLFISNKFNTELDHYYYLEGVFDSIFVENGIAIGGIFPNTEQKQILYDKYHHMKGVWIPDNPWLDESSKKEIIKKSKTNPRDLVFYWNKSYTSKDINEHVIKSKNTNYFNEEYLKSNTTTLLKYATALRFNKPIRM